MSKKSLEELMQLVPGSCSVHVDVRRENYEGSYSYVSKTIIEAEADPDAVISPRYVTAVAYSASYDTTDEGAKKASLRQALALWGVNLEED